MPDIKASIVKNYLIIMTQRKKRILQHKNIYQTKHWNYLFSPYMSTCLKYAKARKPPSKIIKVHGYQSHLLTINLGFEIMYSIDWSLRSLSLSLSLSFQFLSPSHFYLTLQYHENFAVKMSRYFDFFLKAVSGEPQQMGRRCNLNVLPSFFPLLQRL